MPRKIVYDLETQRGFDEVKGRKPESLGISILVVYDYSDNQYKSFRENELKNLWPLLEDAELVIGFNQKGFDNKVLNAYYPGDIGVLPQLDLLEEFYKAAGFRVRLDNLAQVNLGEEKLGSGLQALKWYKEGNFEDLEKYCRQDVKVTKDLYEYALKNGVLKYKEINEVKEIALDTLRWNTIQGTSVNYTLPF